MKRYIPDWADTTKKASRTRVFGMLTSFSRLKLVGELYLDGWNRSAIAASTGLSKGTVDRFVKRANLAKPAKFAKPGDTWQPVGRRLQSVRKGR